MSEYMIEYKWDDKSDVWYAINDDIPIAMESGSLDVRRHIERGATWRPVIERMCVS